MSLEKEPVKSFTTAGAGRGKGGKRLRGRESGDSAFEGGLAQ